MVMEQWFSPSKAVLVFILATFTGGLSSTAVANLPAGAVIRATRDCLYQYYWKRHRSTSLLNQ